MQPTPYGRNSDVSPPAVTWLKSDRKMLLTSSPPNDFPARRIEDLRPTYWIRPFLRTGAEPFGSHCRRSLAEHARDRARRRVQKRSPLACTEPANRRGASLLSSIPYR